jgi:hypothetical protein
VGGVDVGRKILIYLSHALTRSKYEYVFVNSAMIIRLPVLDTV